MDLPEAKENLEEFKKKVPDVEVFEVSAATNQGLQKVVDRLAELLDEIPQNPLYPSHLLSSSKKIELCFVGLNFAYIVGLAFSLKRLPNTLSVFPPLAFKVSLTSEFLKSSLGKISYTAIS